MSRRTFRGFHGKACLAIATICLILPIGRGQESKIRQEVLSFNDVTGKANIRAIPETMSSDAARTKVLLAEALKIAQEKKSTLNYNAGIILGKIATEAKDLKAAEFFFRIAMVEAAKLQSHGKLEESYGDLIDAFFDAKKYADAARICQELLDLKTDDGKERIVMRAYTDTDGDTDYIRDNSFDAAKRLRPTVMHIYIQVLGKQGKVDEAIKLVDGIIAEKNHWIDLQLKGRVLHDAGRYEEAAKVFEDVVNRVSKDADLGADERNQFLERYRYSLSSVYIDMDQIDAAAKLLQKLITDNPTNPSYYNDLGYIWADKNMRLDEAEKLIRKALDLDREQRKVDPGGRDNGAYLDSLGWVLFRQKKYKEAKEILTKAVEDKSGQHIDIYDHLGDTLYALGERQGAVDAWRRALETATDSRRDQERKVVVEKKLNQNK